MFKNLLIAMDLSPASIRLLGLDCMGPLRGAGAESVTLVHVMDVRNAGGLYLSMKNLVEPILKDKEKPLAEMGFRTRLEIPLGDPALEINRVARETDASVIGGGTWRKRSWAGWRTTWSIGPRSLSSWCRDPSKAEGEYGMGWMCACGRENDDHSNECIECHNLRRREQTEEDLERLLEEELKASRKITTKLT